jgi:long-chain acyl-CoA synthetase
VHVTQTDVTNHFLHLKRNAEDNPSGIFLRSAETTVTNASALVSVQKLAYELRRLGVKPGDVVALDLPDQLSILFTEACFHEAATSTILPKGYVADGIFAVDWVFSSGTPTPQHGAHIITVDSKFLKQVDQNPFGISPREGAADIVRIVFSSGTTGTPNAVPFRLESDASSAAVMGSWLQGDPFLMLFDTSAAWGFGAFTLSVKHSRPFLSVGGAAQDAIVRMAVENAVTSIKASPAQLAALVDELDAQGLALPSVQSIFVGGTVMPAGLAERLQRVTQGCRIISLYGSTEARMATVRAYESDNPFDVGQILPGSQVEIVDEDDNVLPDGQVGSVRYKHPSMAHEYLGNPEATAKCFRNGWFYPGDLGLIRPDKGLTLAGRESEVLNAGGVKVNPGLLDAFASRNPKVQDACSFEYTTGSGVRQIGIALVSDDDLDAPALVRELAGEFGSAAPTLVARVDEIPRNAAGKPLRRELAEKYGES